MNPLISTLGSFGGATLVLSLLLVAPLTSSAQSQSSLHPSQYDKRFGDLPFGQDLDELMKYIEADTTNRYNERIVQTPDQHERDRLKAESRMRVQAVRDSYVEFTGQKTGYNVSVIAKDFAHSTGEAMLVSPVDRSHDHYFFAQGKVWKLLITDSRQRFPVLLVNLTQLYGAPESVRYRDPDTKTAPFSARWQDDALVFEVEERPDYGTVTLRWMQREVADRIHELRGASRPPADDDGEELDPTIQDIMKD